MKRRRQLVTSVALCVWLALALTVNAQIPGIGGVGAGGGVAQQIQSLTQVLHLSPTQVTQLTPILQQELPKIATITKNPSLTGAQKAKQAQAVHGQTDPQVKSILNPTQYQQWQTIRNNEIENLLHSAGGGE